MIIALFILFAINVPIAFALGTASLIVLLLVEEIPLLVLAQRMFTGTDSFVLISIPFFLLAGAIMERGGVSERLIEFAQSLFGHIRGALGSISVASCMFFAGISGSAVADTAAVGRITIPAMIKRGYHTSYATSITATAGAIGIIIPPSIFMILFSVVSGASVGQLFLGGIIPGVLIGLVLMIIGYVIAVKRNYPTEQRTSIKVIFKNFVYSFPALLMPVIILSGILFGVVTATESAVVAVVYGLLLGFFVYKKLKLSDLPAILYETVLTSAMIMFIVANASVFAWVLTSQGFSQNLASILAGISTDPVVVMLIFMVVFLIAGTFLDTSAALIIITPVLIPIAQMANIDMVHFGVLTIIALAIGLATPPVGLNLFVTMGIAKVDIFEVLRGIWPFLLGMIAILILIVFFPSLVTYLPSLMMD